MSVPRWHCGARVSQDVFSIYIFGNTYEVYRLQQTPETQTWVKKVQKRDGWTDIKFTSKFHIPPLPSGLAHGRRSVCRVLQGSGRRRPSRWFFAGPGCLSAPRCPAAPELCPSCHRSLWRFQLKGHERSQATHTLVWVLSEQTKQNNDCLFNPGWKGQLIMFGISVVTINKVTHLPFLRVISGVKRWLFQILHLFVALPVLMMNLMASGPSVSYRGTTTME